MGFLKLYLRAVTLLPSVIQGVETLYGTGAGARKRHAAISIFGAAINVGQAVESTKIVDQVEFTAALGMIVDGMVACLNASVWAKAAVKVPG